MTKCLLVIASLIFLSSCHLGPSYDPPEIRSSPSWKTEEATVEIPSVNNWWEIFDDPILNEMECYAIQNSPNLYMALEKVMEARAIVGENYANLFPQLNLNPNYSDTMFLAQFGAPNGAGFGLSNQPFRFHQFNYALPLDLSYQLDLWGQVRGQVDSAFYSAQAQAAAYDVALLTLTSDLASTYFQMSAFDAQLDLLSETMRVRKEAYEVNQARWDAGLVNYTDVTRAALEYTNAESQYCDAKRLRSMQENQLATLIGVSASQFEMVHRPLIAPPPQVPAGLPSSVLLRRPDIAQAERQMASKHALIGVAYAAFFPQVSLTGALGFLSPDLQDFLNWKSRLWKMGASATQNVFDGGRNRADLQAAWARFYQASGTYQNQVLVAFQEVEDALSNLEWQAKQYAYLEKSVEAGKLTTLLSTDRYNRGLVNYLDVVDSERAELEVEVTAIQLLGQRYLSTIQLIKAIGGGWDSTN